MQILAGKPLLSATDLVNFLGSKHASFLDLRDLTDPAEIPERNAATVLIFEKGIEHEKRYLASQTLPDMSGFVRCPSGLGLRISTTIIGIS